MVAFGLPGDEGVGGMMRRWVMCGIAAVVVALAMVFAGCSGGGTPASATPTVPARVPSAAEIDALIGQGFVGETIDYSQTLISAFRSPQPIIAQVDDCAGAAPAKSERAATFWPTLLGQCYFAGNATMRLYQFTHRSEFLDANKRIEALHEARFREAVADGLKVADGYWPGVQHAIYDAAFNPTGTPTAAARR